MNTGDDGFLTVQFIPGNAKDGQSLSLARSHAMKVVRSRQKRRKQRESARRGYGASCPRNERPVHPEICMFQQATLDPFTLSAPLPPQLGGKYAHVVDEIKAHALTFCPMKGVVFPVAAQHPALMTSMLYMSYAHLWSMRGHGDPSLSLRLKAAAVSEINRKMAQPSTATCTNLIAAVAYLAMGTWGFDDPSEEITAHLGGVEAMVTYRGMPSLGIYKFGQSVRKLLALQHVVMAGITARAANPVFDLDNESDLGLSQDFMESMIISSWDELQKSLPPQSHDRERLRRLVDNIDGLVGLVAAEENGSMTVSDCSRQLNELHEQLLGNGNSALESSQHAPRGSLEAFRLAAGIVVEALIARKTLKTNGSVQGAALVDCIRRSDFSHRQLEATLISLFVLMIGSVSISDRQDQRFLRCMLSQTISTLAVMENGFSAGIWIARRFISLQEAISRRSS